MRSMLGAMRDGTPACIRIADTAADGLAPMRNMLGAMREGTAACIRIAETAADGLAPMRNMLGAIREGTAPGIRMAETAADGRMAIPESDAAGIARWRPNANLSKPNCTPP